MISSAGTVALVRLHNKSKETVYKEILKKIYVPNLRTANNQEAVFMHVNASYHTAKSVKTFLSEEDVTVMEWTVQNADMHQTKHVWKLINEKATKESKKSRRTMD